MHLCSFRASESPERGKRGHYQLRQKKSDSQRLLSCVNQEKSLRLRLHNSENLCASISAAHKHLVLFFCKNFSYWRLKKTWENTLVHAQTLT